MSTPHVDAWSRTLHRRWGAAMTAPDRPLLGSEVLGILLGLPGAVAVGYAGQDPGERTRWVTRDGRALTDELAFDLEGEPVSVVAAGDTGPLGDACREAGGETLVVAGFRGSSAGAAVVPGVVFGGTPEPDSLVAYFSQVAEAGRQALDRLARQSLLEEAQNRDALLAEASLQMDAVLEVAQTAQRVARMAVPSVAEGCLVYLGAGDAVLLTAAVHVDARRRWPDDATRAHLAWLLALVARTVADPTVPAGDSGDLSPAAAEALGARSLAITVLRARGRLLGAVVFLFDRAGDRVPDPPFLRDLTGRAALAIDNAELYEQRRRDVMTLQDRLLPSTLRVVPGVEAAATYTVADETLEVGGDFYDVVPQLNGGAAVIGDVCGRGVGAAALTGMARHTISTLLHEGMSGERALSRLNTVLRHDGSWRFVTGAVATFRLHPDGGLAVRPASAGHPPALVLRASGKVDSARGGGVVLGVREPARIGTSRLRLAPGDTLLLFTDGLTEARDAHGVMFEDAALRPSLEGMQSTPVAVLVEKLSRLATDFGRRGEDDIAILGLRR